MNLHAGSGVGIDPDANAGANRGGFMARINQSVTCSTSHMLIEVGAGLYRAMVSASVSAWTDTSRSNP